MSTLRIFSFCLIASGWLLHGCVGKVSGRFDLEQNFRTGVRINDSKPDKRTLSSCWNWE